MGKQTLKLVFLLFICVKSFSQSDSLFIETAKNPKKYTIGGITIEGADNTDKNVLSLLSGLTVGDEITIPGDKISEAIKALWKQSIFEDIQILQDKIIGNNIFLIIKVLERPRLSKFSFKGDVKKSDADDIRTKIRLLQGRVVTDYMVGTIKNTVRDHYLDKGYYFNQVEIIQVKDTTKKVPHTIVTIKVTKGRKVRIQDVNIYGNTVIKDWKLRRKLEDSKPFRWYNPFNSGKYLEENIKKDIPAIATKYNAKGYRDARVVKDTVYFVSDNRVAIDITIDEGHKYYFGNFNWFGNSKYRSGQLDTILNIPAGTVYDQSKLEQKLFMNPNGYDISSLYMDDGYLFFQVNPQESNIHNDTIDFDILMYEGKQATINKITIKGNDKTNDHVIYREIFTKPGQLFRRSDIIRTQRQLSQLGYFDPEKLNVVPTPNPAEGTVDIEYTVEEKPSDQIELSGGWGGRNSLNNQSGQGGIGIIGTLGVTFNNFSTKNIFKKDSWRPLPSGDGQRLSIRAQTNGVFYQSYNFSFTEPWLGGKKPNSLTVSAFHSLFSNGQKKYVDSEVGKIFNPRRQSMSIIGGSVGLGKRLKWPDNYFNMFANLNYNYYDLKNYGAFIFANGYANDLNLGLTISRNSIDQPIYPKTGSNFVFHGQFTPPYSLVNNKDYTGLSDAQRYKFIEYQKYKFTAEWFTQLTNKKAAEGKEARNLVLRTKVGYGFLARYNKAVGYSPFERFYMGGSGISGFQNFVAREIIALRGYPDNSLSSSFGDPICARYTMEVRYPISLNPQATIFILGFAEAGNSWSDYKKFNPFQVKRSAGFGLRVFLPMFGLLGIDYGWGFDDVPGQPGIGNGKGQFHFTIGGALGEL
ncbi:outer membrane protein assembly factor BamA [Sediminibacterium sp.]|uniref:outer membrane protein assembly factor BamA n=1 Tax=Sediminibacterium sp. TaxID=1917865 RepID=UPI002715CADC|nr:outer membrane protein assembly factor BamA [Sediminibacterium sp.]MDO9000475.1 outer membrane protein assembly factor BamA [Bacteroidota bacterium]MDP3146957.1 outer membrane protein assembly factor BamA [Bacteroidota bacterium]MDP3567505.1 outer membrane protein assembly factor BamA [Sediminibacterium sp.]